MAIRPDFDIGTITLSSGSADFTTTGSALEVAKVSAGDAIITPSGHVLIIASITGQNSGTLFLPCPAAAAGTDLPLRIRFQPDGSRYQGAVRNLIDLLSSGNLEAFAALVGASGMVPIFTGPGTLDLANPATFGIQDPNGSLAKLAALQLAASKILNTDGAGNLTQSDITAAALVLLNLVGTVAANKLPFFDASDSASLTDFTAAARALLNLTGTASANQMPYLTADNAAALTPLTAFARSILDDTTGAAMFATMGTTQSLGGTAYVKFPNGLLIQWGSPNVTPSAGGYLNIPFPTAFTNTNWVPITMNSQYLANPQMLILQNRDAVSSTGLDVRLINAATGAAITTLSRVNWIAIGN